MFEFLTTQGRHDAGPLSSAATAERFWRLLPRRDPFAAQQRVSEALADLAGSNHQTRDQLRALLFLDERARKLTDALMINYVSGGSQPRALERRAWQSAFLLCQSFGEAYARSVRHIRGGVTSRGWGEYTPTVLLRLFQHRQIECLLRPFVHESSASNAWPEIHGAYRCAESSRLSTQSLETRRWRTGSGDETTLEREYVHVLLIDLINQGQFSPYDAFWLSHRIPQWCSLLTLRSEIRAGADAAHDYQLVVDLDSADGLVHSPRPAGNFRYLDGIAMRGAIEEEMARLRNPATPFASESSFGRGRQLKLLRKVNAICMPKAARVSRRGERRPTTSMVKCVIGLSHITRMLRNEDRMKVRAALLPAPDVEEITITASGGYSDSSDSVKRNLDERAAQPVREPSVPHQVWQLKDRSESGCGLRGDVGEAIRIVPGSLIAFREREGMPWTLGVVRRLQKRIGDEADIGVEYIGKNPVGVALAAIADEQGTEGGTSESPPRCFAALYLPASARHPSMPFKTLVLSTQEYRSNRSFSVRAADAGYTIRLKEPIEEQDEFIWLPYEVVGRQNSRESSPDREREDMPAVAKVERATLAQGSPA